MANKTCRTKTQVDLKKCFRKVNVFSHFWPCLIPCESRASLFFDEITECKRPPWLVRSKQSATGWSFSLNCSPLQAAGALRSQSSKVPAVNQVRVCFYVKFNFFFSLNTASVFSVYLTFQKKRLYYCKLVTLIFDYCYILSSYLDWSFKLPLLWSEYLSY